MLLPVKIKKGLNEQVMLNEYENIKHKKDPVYIYLNGMLWTHLWPAVRFAYLLS